MVSGSVVIDEVSVNVIRDGTRIYSLDCTECPNVLIKIDCMPQASFCLHPARDARVTGKVEGDHGPRFQTQMWLATAAAMSHFSVAI